MLQQQKLYLLLICRLIYNQRASYIFNAIQILYLPLCVLLTFAFGYVNEHFIVWVYIPVNQTKPTLFELSFSAGTWA